MHRIEHGAHFVHRPGHQHGAGYIEGMAQARRPCVKRGREVNARNMSQNRLQRLSTGRKQLLY